MIEYVSVEKMKALLKRNLFLLTWGENYNLNFHKKRMMKQYTVVCEWKSIDWSTFTKYNKIVGDVKVWNMENQNAQIGSFIPFQITMIVLYSKSYS